MTDPRLERLTGTMDEPTEVLAETISGRAVRPADCGHADECDCELVSLCPACGDPIDYCQGHGAMGDPTGAAVLAAHDHDRHADCHPEGCDYRHEHEAGRHALCRPLWCAWGLTPAGFASVGVVSTDVETLCAEQLVESLRVLFRFRGHSPATARIANDACRLWLESNPAYVEPSR